MILILYCIISLGICYAWNDTEISRPMRNIVARIPYVRSAMLCHECSSFWIGLVLSFFIDPVKPYCDSLVSHILSAFCSFFINLLFVRNKYVSLKD